MINVATMASAKGRLLLLWLWLVGSLWGQAEGQWMHPRIEWGPDLAGPWCARRPVQQCCEGRRDECSMPILGTICYCDIFCNSTAYDCCPDYWSYCHGINFRTTTLPPRTTRRPNPLNPRNDCFLDGVYYSANDVVKNNCNNCTCEYRGFPEPRYTWQCTNEVCLIRPQMIEAVNNEKDFGWRAGNISTLWGLTLDQGLRYRLGTYKLEQNVVEMNPLRVRLDEALPEFFDAREEWPGKIGPVADQGNCASSWAFTSTGVLSDRLSIESDGAVDEELSPQHVLDCNRVGQDGCEGGKADRAWWYLRKVGVTTTECYPYTSGLTNMAGECLIPRRFRQGLCPSGVQYKPTKRYKSTPPYRLRPDEREIMKEIRDNGPVQAIFEVKEDFFVYRSGVYRHTGVAGGGEGRSGYHSARIIGWGSDRSPAGDIVKYWLCANSWGREWGEEGYFRILRGTNECEIESNIVGAFGKVTEDVIVRTLILQNRRRRLRGSREPRHLRTSRRRSRKQRRHLGKPRRHLRKKAKRHLSSAERLQRRLRRRRRRHRRHKMEEKS